MGVPGSAVNIPFQKFTLKLKAVAGRFRDVLHDVKEAGGGFRHQLMQVANEFDFLSGPLNRFVTLKGKAFSDIDYGTAMTSKIAFKMGHRYVMKWEIAPTDQDFYIVPGTGVVNLEGGPGAMRIYNVDIDRKKNIMDVYFEIIKPAASSAPTEEPSSSSERSMLGVVPILIPIAVIVAAIAGVIIGVVTLKSLKEVKDITVSPFFIFIGCIGMVFLLRSGVIGKLARSK